MYPQQTFYNQKVICVHSSPTRWRKFEQASCSIGIDCVYTAIRRLSSRAFKLFLFMIAHHDGDTFPLSFVQFNGFSNMDRNSYDKAVHELIEAGYLVRQDGVDNCYVFRSYIEQ